jgi:hypothetical protein
MVAVQETDYPQDAPGTYWAMVALYVAGSMMLTSGPKSLDYLRAAPGSRYYRHCTNVKMIRSIIS